SFQGGIAVHYVPSRIQKRDPDGRKIEKSFEFFLAPPESFLRLFALADVAGDAKEQLFSANLDARHANLDIEDGTIFATVPRFKHRALTHYLAQSLPQFLAAPLLLPIPE